VINAAASDRPGSLRFTTATGKEWLSYSGENKSREDRIIAEGETLNRIQVSCLTLNEILKDIEQKINFISLDVEAHEFDVLGNYSPASILLKQHGYSKKFHLGSNSFYTHISDQGVFSWSSKLFNNNSQSITTFLAARGGTTTAGHSLASRLNTDQGSRGALPAQSLIAD
jgi:hypothetical protein